MAEHSEDTVIIKKYANRRLYNTAASSYVTLDHLSEMVREGIRLHHIGRIQELPSVCQRKLREVMATYEKNRDLILLGAYTYGTDPKVDYAIDKMKAYGIVDSGDTLTLGVGAMTDERMADFYAKMVASGLIFGMVKSVERDKKMSPFRRSLGIRHL